MREIAEMRLNRGQSDGRLSVAAHRFGASISVPIGAQRPCSRERNSAVSRASLAHDSA